MSVVAGELAELTAPVRRTRHGRPHEAYRPSRVWGVETLPTHWAEKPLKRIADINTDKLSDSTDPDFELEYVDIGNVTLTEGVTSTERLRFENAPSRARRLVRDGDTIVSTVRTYLKAVAHIVTPPQNLVVSTGFAVLRGREAIHAPYLYRLAQSEAFVQAIVAHSVGVSYPAINASDIGRFYVPLPPRDEQRAIAAFLDRETARIDALISKKQRLIELLQEKRSSFISLAVTRGIDADVDTRESGVPWLGLIARHWRVEKFKYRFRRIEQGWSPQCDNRLTESGDWGVLKVGCMNTGIYDESENKALPQGMEPIPRYEVRVGDLLMSRSNTAELVGSVGRVHATQGRIMLCDKLYRIAIDESKLNPDYAVHLLRSRAARLQLERDATGASASMKNISNDRVGNLVFAFPKLQEQARILNHVTPRLEELDALIERIRDGIDRLREYRSALISAAVTGKIDVRNCREDIPCQ